MCVGGDLRCGTVLARMVLVASTSTARCTLPVLLALLSLCHMARGGSLLTQSLVF